MQSTRETRESGQRGVGQSIGRRAEQSAPLYGGYGYGGMVNPFMAVRRMMEDMDRFVSSLGFGGIPFTPSLFGQEGLGGMGGGGLQSSGGLQTIWNPQVDVFQRGDQLVIRADLPGLKRDDVNVEIDQNVLTIRGQRRQEFEDENEGVYRSERSYGSFQRSILLPEGVSPDDAQASFNDGVLEITLKTPRNQQRTKRIQVR